MFYSRPGIVHQIQSEQGMQLLFVAFELNEQISSEEWRAGFQALADSSSIYRTDGDDLPCATMWRSLLIRADGKPSIPEAALSGLAGGLLLSFLPVFGQTAEQERIPAHRSASLALKQAKLYIHDNLQDPDLSLDKVAAHISLSSRHLSRLFSANVLESYTRYVRQQRVRRAAELLLRSERSIKEIAEETGFGSVHYFTRTFGALMNATPAKYRDGSPS